MRILYSLYLFLLCSCAPVSFVQGAQGTRVHDAHASGAHQAPIHQALIDKTQALLDAPKTPSAVPLVVSSAVPSNVSSNKAPLISVDARYAFEVSKDLVYGKGLSHSDWNSPQPKEIDLKLDVYRPLNADGKRPAVILIHGGSFRTGSKDVENIVASAEFFAARGFVAIAINYRLASHFGTLPEEMNGRFAHLPLPSFMRGHRDGFLAVYPAARDAKAAARWLFAHADELNINKNFVTALGNSAGAMLSIVLGMTEPEQFRDEISKAVDRTLPHTFLEQVPKIQTVIDRWGSPYALDVLKFYFDQSPFDERDAALQIVHGAFDLIVPYSEALRLVYLSRKHDVPFELHTLLWSGHSPLEKRVNDMSLDELALQFIARSQGLSGQLKP